MLVIRRMGRLLHSGGYTLDSGTMKQQGELVL